VLKGIDINQKIEFVSKEDTSEPKTVFIFVPLSGADTIGMSGIFEGGMAKLTGKAIVDFLDKCIVEIKNFEGETDKIKIISSLTTGVISELVTQASEINNLKAQETKN